MDLRSCIEALQSLAQHEDERIRTLWADFRRAWFEENPDGHHMAFFLFAHDNVPGSIVEAYCCIEHSDAYASLASSPDKVQSRLNSTAGLFYTTPHVLLEALGLDACSSRSSLEHVQTAQRQNPLLHLDDLIRAILRCAQRKPKVIVKTLIRDAVKDHRPPRDEPTEAECGPQDKAEISLGNLSPLPKACAATPERYSPDLGLAGSPESPAAADSSYFPDEGSIHHSSDCSALEHSSPVITADTDARSASLFAATALAPSLFEDSYSLEVDTPEPHKVPSIATADERLETNSTRDVEVMANLDVQDDAAAAQPDKRQQPHDEEVADAAAIRHACRIRVTAESLVEGLATLREHQWLNDTVVNVMLHRGVGSKMGLIDSLTLAKAGHQRSERCRERLAPLFLAENVMMPSCDGSHWRLFVYNRPTHTISELDSLELRNNIAEEQVIPTLSWLYGAAWHPDVQVKKAEEALTEANRMALRAIDLLKAAIPGQHSTSGISVEIAAGAVELHHNNSSSMIRTLKRIDNDSAWTCYPGLLYMIHLAASLCRCRYKEFRAAVKAFEECK
ncbi:hypothetical protein K4K54_007375 [Colletotrichum sp. SAR 10_86]|nr:hypothetical protein K4K54_007375 [Colletotrichum sp. SAR 10_86]